MVVIPAINADTMEDARKKINIVSPFASWVHFDIADGVFTRNVLWGSPEDLKIIRQEFPAIRFEVHLMVDCPFRIMKEWYDAGCERIIAHVESINASDSKVCKNLAASLGKEYFIALLPDTHPEAVLPHLAHVDGIMVLAVQPGKAGQKFQSRVLETVCFLREHAPNVTIEVDGGINDDIATYIKKAGATHIVSASYIFNHPDPKAAYKALMDA